MKNNVQNEDTSLYTSFVSRFLFPLHEHLKGHESLAVRRELERSQWWPKDRLQELQLSKLRSLLTHAQTHVPYYRQLFALTGFKPNTVNCLADLNCVPCLDKARIRTNIQAMKAENAKAVTRFNTGGSTGEPLVFYIGKERISHDVAAKWRATRWWGVDIGDPEIVVWGSPIELGAQDRARAIRDQLFRTKLIPAFQMSEQNLDRYLDNIRSIRPRMLFGYPSALSLIAKHAQTKGRSMDDLGIRVAFVTAERLYEEQRRQISETFGCIVANGYGSRDAGFIAHECPEGGMHITAEDIILEILDPQGAALPAGQAGEIVITHLATRDFPFIRYRTGDIAILGTERCRCGRGLPLLKEIHGRSTDFVIAQDGTVMHGLALIYILRDLPQIRSFKIIQESRDLIRALLIADPRLNRELMEKIEAGFKSRLGQGVKISIEEVAEIAPEKSGKFHYVVSNAFHG